MLSLGRILNSHSYVYFIVVLQFSYRLINFDKHAGSVTITQPNDIALILNILLKISF